MWDPFNIYYDDIAGSGDNSWNDRTRWSNLGGTVSIDTADGSNPYSLPTLKGDASNTRLNRRLYIDELGVYPGDVISAGALVNAASGTYYLRITFRDSGGTSISTADSATAALSGTTTRFAAENKTIPASTFIIDIGIWYSSGTNAEKSIYAMWLNAGPIATYYPSPSVSDAFLRSQLGDDISAVEFRHQITIKPLTATTFAAHTYWSGDNRVFQWRFQKNATTNLWQHDTGYVATAGGTVVDTVVLADIGFTMSFTPSGQAAELTGNSHNNMSLIETLFEDELGNTIDVTQAGTYDSISIINRGYVRHSATGTTNHFQFAYVITIDGDGVHEHVHLECLQNSTTINYLNAGQYGLSSGADYALAIGSFGPLAPGVGSSDIKHAGATEGWQWDEATGYGVRVVSPQAVTMAIREDTLKLYPRSIDDAAPDSVDNGDYRYAAWHFYVVQKANVGNLFAP